MGAFVLFYHRVFPQGPAPDVDVATFDWQLGHLARHYTVVTLDEVVAHARGALRLPRRSVAITFDDGWFDNFVYAYPILKKHGLKATVFVATGRIGGEARVRPTLEDCWQGRAAPEELQRPLGVQEGFDRAVDGDQSQFLTWEELRVLERSQVFDVQSHGAEHASAFCGDAITGFSDGRPGWAVRSAARDQRPGVPLYPAASALRGPAFRPDPGLNDHLAELVARGGGPVYLARPDAEAVLRGEVGRYRSRHPGAGGNWETEEEATGRILGELEASRRAIRRELGHEARHLC
ncbi:MAG: polysaccharide deacetylase family protein, partial [Deferrisomatales bacterium]